MSNLIPFFFEGRPVRILVDENGNWKFIAKDVVEAIDAVWKGGQTIAHVPEQWRGVTSNVTTLANQHGEFGTQEKEVWYLTDQGLYFYLGRSDKPKALPFQMWYAGEVIPSVMKTGSYSLPGVRRQVQPQLPATHNFWDFWKQLDSLTKEYGAARCPAHKHAIFLQMEMLRDMHGYPVDETMRRLHAQALNPPEHPLMAEFWEAYDLIGADKLNHSPDFDMIAISPADFFRMASDAGFDFNKAQVEHCLPRSLRYKYLGKKMTDSRIEPERMPVCWLFGVNT